MKNKKTFLANALIIGLSSIIVYAFIYLVLVVSGDELWNFNNAYKMYNGYTLYKDSNLIITPFFFYIAYALFDIFFTDCSAPRGKRGHPYSNLPFEWRQ